MYTSPCSVFTLHVFTSTTNTISMLTVLFDGSLFYQVQDIGETRHAVHHGAFDEFCDCGAVAGGVQSEPQPLD